MKIHDVRQGSADWLQLRAGVPTASEFKNLVDSDFNPRTGEMPKTYLHTKLAEKWIGRPLESYSGGDMEQGKILEHEGIPALQLEYPELEGLFRPGFITTDDGAMGCSPDAMMPDDSGVEIKCPREHTHVAYLLGGKLPSVYAPQVHGSMLVTGAKLWRFASYCRGFPPLLLEIRRDEDLLAKLAAAIAKFNLQLEVGYQRLVKLNGGPPAERPSIRTALDQAGRVVSTMEGVPEDAIDQFLASEASLKMESL